MCSLPLSISTPHETETELTETETKPELLFKVSLLRDSSTRWLHHQL